MDQVLAVEDDLDTIFNHAKYLVVTYNNEEPNKSSLTLAFSCLFSVLILWLYPRL